MAGNKKKELLQSLGDCAINTIPSAPRGKKITISNKRFKPKISIQKEACPTKVR